MSAVPTAEHVWVSGKKNISLISKLQNGSVTTQRTWPVEVDCRIKEPMFQLADLKIWGFQKISFVPCALSVLEQLMRVIWCDTLTLCLAGVIWGTSKRVIVLVMRPRRGKNNQSLRGMFFIGFLPKCPQFYGEPAASPIRKDAALAFYRPLTPARLQHLWPNLYAEVLWRERREGWGC